MVIGLVILNVVFAVLVVAAMVALHGWAIATDPWREPRLARVRPPRQRESAQWDPRLAPAAR